MKQKTANHRQQVFQTDEGANGMTYSSPDNFPFGIFAIIPVIIIIGFVVVFGIIIANLIKGGRQWSKNNQSPVLTVDAAVVAKRVSVLHNHMGSDGTPITASATTYFATFEVASGDRMEFKIGGREYGMLAEKDRGRLTFQGTRYLSFDREKGDGF